MIKVNTLYYQFIEILNLYQLFQLMKSIIDA